jgi:hypothetical protein
MPVVAWLVGIVVVVAIVLLVVVTRRRDRERTEALGRVAETMGFSFEPRAEVGTLRARGDSPLFERGHSKRVKNLMAGRLSDSDLLVFDYQYTIGSGKNQNTVVQTVVMFPGAKGGFPDLQMSPENVFHRIGQAFGYQDIDFESSPEFSKRYLVRGGDEAGIRTALYPEAVSYFAAHEGWTVEVKAGTVVAYRGGLRAKAEEMRAFVDAARDALLHL